MMWREWCAPGGPAELLVAAAFGAGVLAALLSILDREAAALGRWAAGRLQRLVAWLDAHFPDSERRWWGR